MRLVAVLSSSSVPSLSWEITAFHGKIFTGRGSLLLCVAHVYCVIGEGATRHWNSTGKPFNYKHGLGMTLAEYTSHLSVWYVCSVSLP